MTNRYHYRAWKAAPAAALSFLFAFGWILHARAASDDPIIIEGTASLKRLVKIAVAGFPAEVQNVLRFDLEVAGFEMVAADQAQFLVESTGQVQVAGTVTDRISRNVLLAKAFSGGGARSQAHAFSDAIVEKLTGQTGIAQTRIAFKASAGDTSEIYVSDYDGHNPLAITQDRTIVAAPAWGPANQSLFYTSYRLGNPDIFSHNLQSGERKIVARYTGLNTSAAVSPDGRRIAMVLSKGGSPDIFVADIGGGNLRQCTTTKQDESSPCWSPDSRTLCFTSRISGRAALYTMPADGGSMKRLPTTGVINTTEPDWSPDGQSIVFTSMMGSFQVCVLHLKTGNTTVLCAGEDPAWAPNSRTVMFVRRLGNQRVLSLLDVPTKRVKDIARISGNSSQPAWAR